MARNLETFARCRVVLADGGTIALFPEGYSHNEPAAVPAQDGGGAHRAGGGQRHGAPGLRVLPVGLVYEDKEHFRSRVLVQVGEPIDPAPRAGGVRATRRATP